jgi:NAD(P)-dependent dehydrogenase (short-subunit alcohol dehydrogenase family)
MAFDNRNFLITGGFGGIGSAIARELLAAGARVFISGRGGPAGTPPDLGPRVQLVDLDVTAEREWELVVGGIATQFGALDGLINNAGLLGPARDFTDLSLADWSRHMRVNLDGAFLGCRCASRLMARTGGGAIVNISSGAARIMVPEAAAYCVSKAALLALTRVAAKDGARHNVRVNAILPGAIDTAMLWRNLPAGMPPGEFLGMLGRTHSLGRIGLPVDVAKAVVFLCDPDNAFITGAGLAVDGGQLVE